MNHTGRACAVVLCVAIVGCATQTRKDPEQAVAAVKRLISKCEADYQRDPPVQRLECVANPVCKISHSDLPQGCYVKGTRIENWTNYPEKLKRHHMSRFALMRREVVENDPEEPAEAKALYLQALDKAIQETNEVGDRMVKEHLAQVQKDSQEEYQTPEAEAAKYCSFVYWTPRFNKDGREYTPADLASWMAGKTKLSVQSWATEYDQGTRWIDALFDESAFQRKPERQPKFLYGTLRPHALSEDQLEQNFGKKHRKNMDLSGPYGRVTVRFPSGPVPCGQVNVFFKKWKVEEGVLVISDPAFKPARAGE